MHNNIRQNYKLILTYDGTRYSGWQRLGEETSKSPAIQFVLEEVLSKYFDEDIKVIGSGRTDAYVHALGQVANFHGKKVENLIEMKNIINKMLPEDIKVKSIEMVPKEFHSRYNAKGKTYLYVVDTKEKASVFTRKYCYHYPKKLDIDKMRKASKLLEGTHDFAGFSSKMTDGRPTIKTIYKIDIMIEDEKIYMKFYGDGFLYHMIRIIVGTLLAIGENELSIDLIEKIFESRNRLMAGITVPGNGLFLNSVEY